MADHNDPNAVNSIFSDIDHSPADLYDLFGFPLTDAKGSEKVVIALTFASVAEAGVLDSDMLYRVLLSADPRVAWPADHSLESVLKYFDAVKDKYLVGFRASEIRVTIDAAQQATVRFINFPGGSFSVKLDLNKVVPIRTPDGHEIQAFIGGGDRPFFYHLPGFFPLLH